MCLWIMDSCGTWRSRLVMHKMIAEVGSYPSFLADNLTQVKKFFFVRKKRKKKKKRKG